FVSFFYIDECKVSSVQIVSLRDFGFYLQIRLRDLQTSVLDTQFSDALIAALIKTIKDINRCCDAIGQSTGLRLCYETKTGFRFTKVITSIQSYCRIAVRSDSLFIQFGQSTIDADQNKIRIIGFRQFQHIAQLQSFVNIHLFQDAKFLLQVARQLVVESYL